MLWRTHFNVFSIDFNEELVAFDGSTLENQVILPLSLKFLHDLNYPIKLNMIQGLFFAKSSHK